MKADRWCICPRRLEAEEEAVTALEETLRESYGVVSDVEYGSLRREAARRRAALDDWEDESEHSTIPLYYEVYLDGRALVVSASGTCRACDWAVALNHRAAGPQ
jgi:hypothetical protein